MKNNFRVGLLSTIDNPLLPFYINSILSQKINNIFVICDAKLISNKNKELWFERTGGAFEQKKNKIRVLYKINTNPIPFYFVENHNSKNTENLIKLLSIDVLLNAGTPRKLSKSLLTSAKYGVVNVHPGSLPEYRGCSAVEWAIFNDERIINTAHFMNEEYDQGPIIKNEKYKFSINNNYQDIRVKVYKKGCLLAGKALKLVLDNKIKPKNGIRQNESKAKYWQPISDDKFKKVIIKINSKSYKYQKKKPYD